MQPALPAAGVKNSGLALCLVAALISQHVSSVQYYRARLVGAVACCQPWGYHTYLLRVPVKRDHPPPDPNNNNREKKAYIKRTGQYLCSMSWEGHEEMGRGAIFANYDDAQAGGKLNEVSCGRGTDGECPDPLVPLSFRLPL